MTMNKMILPALETPAGGLSGLAPGSRYDTRDSSQCVPLLQKKPLQGDTSKISMEWTIHHALLCY